MIQTLLDVRENIHEDSQSEDLVSLDGTQKDTSEKLSAGVHGKTFDYQSTKKQVKKNDGEQRRASSLKPTDTVFFQSNLKVVDQQSGKCIQILVL